jgi:hypothetical protein
MPENFREQPSQENEEPFESKSGAEVWKERLEAAKETSTDTQKEIADIQGAKLETSLLRIMNRTENNPDIVNGLNGILDALDHQSFYGDNSQNIAHGRQEDLAKFLGEAAKALRWTVGGGNRPADVKIDLSKWSL